MGKIKFKIHRIGTAVLYGQDKRMKTNVYRDSKYNFYVKFKGEWHHVRSVQMRKGIGGSVWVMGKPLGGKG